MSDSGTAARVLGRPLQTPPEPENMAPGQAKDLWAAWTDDRGHVEQLGAQTALVEALELDVVAKRSRSFARFLDDLRAPP